MAGKAIDITGQTFGRLTAISLIGSKVGVSAVWRCRCECGAEVTKQSRDLRRGHAVSCGCFRPSNDLLGHRFGRLLVVRRSEDRYSDKSVLWVCVCDCGKEIKKRSSDLKAGKKKSCGCLISDVQRQRQTTHGLSRTIEYQRHMGAIKRARKINSDGARFTVQELEARLDALGRRCLYCHTGKYEQLDHVEPLSRGGRHVLKNIVPACAKCNGSKHNKILFVEWMPPANRWADAATSTVRKDITWQ